MKQNRRFKTRDVAFQFRMGAGFAGDVNRTHPAEIEPAIIDSTTPPTRYGNACVIDATSHNLRAVAATEQSDSVALLPFGLIVRPYPTQQVTGTNYGEASLGAATPPTSGPADFLRAGLILAQLNTGVAAPVKGGTVYIWAAATSGNHVLGGFETEASSGNTVALDARYRYNGPADASGIVEISANV